MIKKLLSFFVLLFLSQQAHSFNFTNDFQKGFFWQQLPLDFHVSEHDKDQKKVLEELTLSAAQVWEEGVNEKIWEFEKKVSGRNIIRWAQDFERETSHDSESTLAVTIRHNQAPFWAKAEIILNPNKKFLKLDPQALRYVLIHELGHTMGLNHSEDPNSVMRASFVGDITDISSDDVQGMTRALEVMEERRGKNAGRSIASLSQDDQSGGTCGTVNLQGPSGPQGGMMQFVFSLLFGLLLMGAGTNRRLFPYKFFL